MWWLWLTWTIRPITITMATQDIMSAWFWMTNSWLSMGRFLLALAFRPLIGAIFKTAPFLNSCTNIEIQSSTRARRDNRRKRVRWKRLKVLLSVEWLWSTLKIGKRPQSLAPGPECVAVALAVYRLLMCQYNTPVGVCLHFPFIFFFYW